MAGIIDPVQVPVGTKAGLVAATQEPGATNTTLALGNGGFIYLGRIWLPKLTTVTSLVMEVVTQGATLTSGQNLAGVYDLSGNLWAQTADQSTNWQSAGFQKMALTAQGSFSLNLPGGFYWLALLTKGTTRPAFAAQSTFVPPNAGKANGAGVYTASVPGATHVVGYESVGGRTSLISLNGLSITDGSYTTFIWQGLI